MVLNSRDRVAIVELVVYIPCFFLALFISLRHGFSRSSGWIYLTILSIARIAGASCQLDTMTNHSKGIQVAAFILASVGLSFLILTCLGLLSRVNDSSKRPFNGLAFRLIKLVSLVGVILAIVGGINTSSASIPTKVDPKTKIGVVLFFVAWLGLCLLLAIIATRISSVEQGEKRIVLAVAVSVPFIFVRILYSLLGSFAKDKKFSSISGSVVLNVAMALIEEFVIVAVLLGTGLTLRVLPKPAIAAPAQDISNHGYNSIAYEDNGAAGFQHGVRTDHGYPHTLPRREFRRGGKKGGPIMQLIGLVKDHYQRR